MNSMFWFCAVRNTKKEKRHMEQQVFQLCCHGNHFRRVRKENSKYTNKHKKASLTSNKSFDVFICIALCLLIYDIHFFIKLSKDCFKIPRKILGHYIRFCIKRLFYPNSGQKQENCSVFYGSQQGSLLIFDIILNPDLRMGSYEF